MIIERKSDSEEKEIAITSNRYPDKPTDNRLEVLRQDPVMSITPRAGHAAAPFRIQTFNSSEVADSSLLLVIHGGFLASKEGNVLMLPNRTEFFDVDTQTWISPEVEIRKVTDLSVVYHTAVSFLHLSGSPVVIYGGNVNANFDSQATACVPNVRILMSEFVESEGRNQLFWRKGKSGPPRCYHAAAAVGSDMVVFGGSNVTRISKIRTNDVYIYNVIKDTWTRPEAKGPFPLQDSSLQW